MNSINVSCIWNRGKQELAQYRFLLKPTCILSAICLLAISAILKADFYYVDDLLRTLEGHANWGFSRYLSNFLSQFLHGDSYLTDISPLTQIIAVIITALSCSIAIYGVTGERDFRFWHIWAAIPMALSPYYLECLSYKYDSPYMALSVLFRVLPVLFANRNAIFYISSIVLCMLGMCTSYQASSGIFPMFVIVIGIRRWVDGEQTKDTLKFFALSACGYLLGLLFFQKVLMSEFIAYASTEIAPPSQLISNAVTNYKRYIVHFITDFKPEWLIVSFIICICYLFSAVISSRQNKVLTLFLVGIAMVLMFLLSFGVYPFLTDPIFKSRAMYGIGYFLGLQCIFAVTRPTRSLLSKLACLVLGWYFFVFSFTYGNALSIQAQYTDYRITAVIDDLIECDTLSSEEDVTLQITGGIGYAPALENMCVQFPILKKLVPDTFVGDGWWGEYGMRYYYGLPDMLFTDTYDPPDLALDLITDNYLHTIYANESYIWIDLH